MQQAGWGPTSVGGDVFEFRLWAPSAEAVTLLLKGDRLPMAEAGDGWFSVRAGPCGPGDEYMFELPGGQAVPDPASRRQPRGVEGPSALADPDAYVWKNPGWRGRPWCETVLYEIHVGAFTPEGTYAAAAERLEEIAALGFTAIELMPLGEFPGDRGWGYDGVYPFAPYGRYGAPDDLKALIDHAHGLGLMVFLDVVYNHFGPRGNFLPLYAGSFFRAGSGTPWGRAIAFEEPAVRRFFLDNIRYWLTEFRFDGFRFDAADRIEDGSEKHIMEEIVRLVESLRGERQCHLVTEDATNGAARKRLAPDARITADWNDDFHHAVHAAVTGECDGHYAPFADAPWYQMGNALAHGYLRYDGEPLVSRAGAGDFEPTAYVHFLQNHDQVGNRAVGDRLYHRIDSRLFRCLTEILLLSPQIPLMFMGDDHLSRRPFLYFVDHDRKLAEAVARGRLEEIANFGGLPPGASPADIPNPADAETFRRSRLDWDDRLAARGWREHLARLIGLRKTFIVPLVAAAGHGRGRNLSIDDRLLWVEWTLGDRVLSLQANLSPYSCNVFDAEGTRVHPKALVRRGIMEAFTAHCYIRPAEKAG